MNHHASFSLSLEDMATWRCLNLLFVMVVLILRSLLLVGKINLGKLYEYIGFNKEIISRGKYAELFAADHRPFRYFIVVNKLNKVEHVNIQDYLDFYRALRLCEINLDCKLNPA